MKLCSAIVLAAASSVSLGQVFEASFVWDVGMGGNGHTYTLYSVQGGINWAAAQADAVSRGGYLATITSAAENNAVYNSLAIETNNNVWHVDSFNSRIGPWLGGLRNATGGWDWVTGEAFSYTNWSPGEPNNSGGTENRIHFFGNPNRASLWNDITDTVPIEGYVVEMNLPAPGSAAVVAMVGLAALRRRR